MTFVAAMPLVPWTVPPDWSGQGVIERLNWLTDVLTPVTGPAQKRRLRYAPRRGFEFDVLSAGRDRRLVDALLFSHSAKRYALPIWHDVQRLTGTLASGSIAIPCRTAGFDFVVGGQALLLRSANRFELVTVTAIGVASITLAVATAQAWSVGDCLYPVRAARIEEPGQDRAYNDRVGRRRVSMMIDEPCDWPEVLPVSTYRSFAVLEHRTDESQDPSSKHERMLLTVDNETGPVSRFDLPGMGFQTFDHRWLLGNRDEHSALRSLFYALAGRFGMLWVPSGNADLQIAGSGGSLLDLTINVDWCGYTIFGGLEKNRRDIRIELRDGTIHYRRIAACVEGGEIETLTLATGLGGLVSVADVRKISFLTLAEQSSDAIELQHTTDADGITRSATTFRAVAYDL